MSALAAIAPKVAELRATATGILDAIRSAGQAEDVSDLRNKVKMAREWAKIQKITREVHLDLLRAEIHCLRRIAQLGAVDVLPKADRPAAAFYGPLSDDEIEALLRQHGSSTTGLGVYRRHSMFLAGEERRESGRRFASGAEYETGRDDDDAERRIFAYAVERYASNHRAALAALLDEYSGQAGFAVSDMVEEFVANNALEEYTNDGAMREGISEVCRTAIRKAPSVVIDGTRAPQFVTCVEPDTGDFYRIPFHSARVSQLAEMVALREEQLRQDEAALDRLRHVLRTVREWSHGDESALLGSVAQSWMLDRDAS